jgi:signal transduction histidine kinase
LTRSLRGSVRRAGAGVIALQLAGAGVTAWAGLRVVEGLAQERALEATQAAVSRVATAAREQYVHQAHTLLARDGSHLDHYAQSALATEAALLALEARTGGDHGAHPEDVALVHAAVETLTVRFTHDVLPRVRDGTLTPDATPALHAALEEAAAAIDRGTRAVHTDLDARGERQRVALQGAIRRAAVWLAVTVATAVASVLAASGSLAQATLPPLTRLTGTSRAFGEGDLLARANLGDDVATEIRVVGEAFDAMADALVAAESARAAAQDRRVATERLAALGEMSAAIAHELMNPLAAIVATTTDPTVRGEAAHAQRVVSGLLAFARGGRDEDAVDVDAAAEAQAALDRAIGLADARDVALTLEVDAAPPVLRAPRGAVRHVLDNLVRNAVQASPQGGRVRVTVAAHGIEVRDEGEGIPSQVRARLYTPFVTGRPDGTGLGLAVARRIVTALGGDLSHEDVTPRGTLARWRFRV